MPAVMASFNGQQSRWLLGLNLMATVELVSSVIKRSSQTEPVG